MSPASERSRANARSFITHGIISLPENLCFDFIFKQKDPADKL